jgi:hypothetical protein
MDDQEITYNGYYAGHGLKYQAIIGGSGLIEDLAPAVTGRHHDSFAWNTSGVEDKIRQLPLHPSGQPYYIYGDPAYPCCDILITGMPSIFNTFTRCTYVHIRV